jgi:hypothetical protein
MMIGLPRQAVLSLDLSGQECFIQCREGKVWVTVPGDSRDHCFEAGDGCSLLGTGRAVIEAVSNASVALLSKTVLSIRVNENFSLVGEAPLQTIPSKEAGRRSLSLMPLLA